MRVITAAAAPVLVKTNSCSTFPSTSRSVPKSHSYSSKTSAEVLFCALPATQARRVVASHSALFNNPYIFIKNKALQIYKIFT